MLPRMAIISVQVLKIRHLANMEGRESLSETPEIGLWSGRLRELLQKAPDLSLPKISRTDHRRWIGQYGETLDCLEPSGFSNRRCSFGADPGEKPHLLKCHLFDGPLGAPPAVLCSL